MSEKLTLYDSVSNVNIDNGNIEIKTELNITSNEDKFEWNGSKSNLILHNKRVLIKIGN
jgi:hypothetical protein